MIKEVYKWNPEAINKPRWLLSLLNGPSKVQGHVRVQKYGGSYCLSMFKLCQSGVRGDYSIVARPGDNVVLYESGSIGFKEVVV